MSTETQPESEFALAEKRVRIAPSILAADFARLSEAVKTAEAAGADLLHLDVMDGHFVPNISFGPGLIKCLRRETSLFFDTHLMITEPARYAPAFAEAGSDLITFHIEVTDAPGEVVKAIADTGCRVGVSLNPTTPASALDAILEEVDLVLVMSVWPGFGGQTFIDDVLPKVAELSKRMRPDQRLEIDGGIDLSTVGKAVDAGADTLVAGTSVFRQPDPVEAVAALRRTATAAVRE